MRRRSGDVGGAWGPRWFDAPLVLLALVVVVVWVLALDRVDVSPTPAPALPGFSSSPTAGPTASPTVGTPDDPDPAPRVLWLGDSLPRVGVDDAARDLVVPVTADLAAAPGPLAGATPVRFDGSLRAGDAIRDLIRSTPEVAAVVLAFGTDAAGAATFTPLFQGLLEEVRRTLPTATLVCLGPWRSDEAGAAIGEVVAAACAAAQGRFVDIADLAVQPDLQAPDDRPDPDGAAVLAERILLALQTD